MTDRDTPEGALTLRVVYYGPPGAGKTTNLERVSALIHGGPSGRITPRLVGENRIASVEVPLGTLGSLVRSNITVRLETIQGEVSSAEGGWASALAGADGIVFVADSLPHARTANVRAQSGIRERIEGRGRTAATIPVLMQWNKRDDADARPVAEMEMELNHRCFPSLPAASRRGTGIAETLIEILKRTIGAARRKAGDVALAEAELGPAVTSAIQRLSQAARAASVESFGMTIDRQPSAWPSVQEPQSLERSEEGVRPGDTVYTSGAPAGVTSAGRMLAALEGATSALDDPLLSGLPAGLMAGLLAGSDRTHGSLLLFRQGTAHMDECEVVPGGTDPLNARQSVSGVTRAATLCAVHEPVFIDEVAGAERLRGALIVPLVFGRQTFGGLVVYVAVGGHAPNAEERTYWKTAATLTSVFLAWQSGDRREAETRVAERRPTLGLDPAR